MTLSDEALETGSDTTLIVQEKQRLRDLTDLANDKTVEELLVILEELEMINNPKTETSNES